MSGDQEKLNEAVKQHLEAMKLLGFLLRFGLAIVLMIVGYVFLLKTNLHFGDVPLVLGAYWAFRTMTD